MSERKEQILLKCLEAHYWLKQAGNVPHKDTWNERERFGHEGGQMPSHRWAALPEKVSNSLSRCPKEGQARGAWHWLFRIFGEKFFWKFWKFLFLFYFILFIFSLKIGVIPKEGRVRPRTSVLLLVWQRLRTLGTFYHDAIQGGEMRSHRFPWRVNIDWITKRWTRKYWKVLCKDLTQLLVVKCALAD